MIITASNPAGNGKEATYDLKEVNSDILYKDIPANNLKID